ncbi:diguanylate cyclase inhibitor YfiR [Comamonas humi]
MAYHEQTRALARPGRAWRWLLLALWGLAAALPLARADSAVEEGVSRTVLGILGYTRWPVEGPVLRLCVVGETDYARTLLNAKAQTVGNRPLEVLRADPGQADALANCDGIYAGHLAEPAWRELMRNLQGRAMLTISERGALCRIGAMFCLKPAKEAVGFEVNLDSVARSGVRVNPRVLQLARQGAAP